jgi:hypothetical protein
LRPDEVPRKPSSCHHDLVDSSIVEPWRAAVFVHLRIRVAEHRQAELRSFLSEAIPFYESPGGIRVRLLANDLDPERFIELVEYIDEHTYRQDESRVESDPTMAAFLVRWRSLLVEPPCVEVYHQTDLAH